MFGTRSRPPQPLRRLPLAAMLCLWGSLLASCGSRSGLWLPDWVSEGEAPLCLELPPDGRLVVDLATDARVQRADVFMLLDTTRSMEEELDEIARRLRSDVAPEIYATIPEVEFGVGIFADFPLPELAYGARDDTVYELRLPMTGDLVAVQNALDSLPLQDGEDPWEAQVEALYQVATGDGLGDFVQPSLGCPSGGFGGPCFRPDAQPIVLMFTDAPFHDGPISEIDASARYLPDSIDPTPHSYSQTVRALFERRIRVIGLWSGRDAIGRRDLELVAEDTGSVSADGDPIVFDIGSDGSRLGSGIVEALRELAGALVYDVDAYASDPFPGDGVDTATFVSSITPLRAEPPEGVEGLDPARSTFLGVRSGTRLIYEVEIIAGVRTPGLEPQQFLLRIHFRGDGATSLGYRDLLLVVPSIDGVGCEAVAQQ